jgi:hypothetical protein
MVASFLERLLFNDDCIDNDEQTKKASHPILRDERRIYRGATLIRRLLPALRTRSTRNLLQMRSHSMLSAWLTVARPAATTGRGLSINPVFAPRLPGPFSICDCIGFTAPADSLGSVEMRTLPVHRLCL